MSDVSLFNTRAPYHITVYGLLSGTQFFQSFIGSIVAYKVLTRPEFSRLQQKLFPIYFTLQTTLSALLFFTFPGGKTITSGFNGARSDKWGTFIPLATTFITSSLNLLLIGPATTSIMLERKVQETRDNKKCTDQGPHSEQMEKLNLRFGTLHSLSTLCNLAGFIGTVWYGSTLAKRIR